MAATPAVAAPSVLRKLRLLGDAATRSPIKFFGIIFLLDTVDSRRWLTGALLHKAIVSEVRFYGSCGLGRLPNIAGARSAARLANHGLRVERGARPGSAMASKFGVVPEKESCFEATAIVVENVI
jgi:hypothetical protein